MNELEFTFEKAPWETELEKLVPGESISAVRFLDLLETADETETENALEFLAQRRITLDVKTLPKFGAVGITAQRLQLEENWCRPETCRQAWKKMIP